MDDSVRRRRRAVRTLIVVWALVEGFFLFYLMYTQGFGDLGCERPAGSSLYGEASWQWFPPGRKCSYGANFGSRAGSEGPSWPSAILTVLLIAGIAALITVAVRRRRRSRA